MTDMWLAPAGTRWAHDPQPYALGVSDLYAITEAPPTSAERSTGGMVTVYGLTAAGLRVAYRLPSSTEINEAAAVAIATHPAYAAPVTVYREAPWRGRPARYYLGSFPFQLAIGRGADIFHPAQPA